MDDTFIKTIMILIMMIIPENDSLVALGKDGLWLIYVSWCSVKMEGCPLWKAESGKQSTLLQPIPGIQFFNLINVISRRKVEPRLILLCLFPLPSIHQLSLSIISHLARSPQQSTFPVSLKLETW